MILEVGDLASHFALLGTDGREYALPRSLNGQPALLIFFKTTCATCDLTFPYVNRLRETYPDGWHLWAISQDAPDKSIVYARRLGVRYPVLLDAPDYAVSRLYDPPATPTFFLVDGGGRVAYSTHGFAKDDINQIARLIAGYVGADPQIIARADDGKPAFKPG